MTQRTGVVPGWLWTLLRGNGAPRPQAPLAECDHATLSRLPDQVLKDAYYTLRNETVPGPRGAAHPNQRRLFATALEREKDRRESQAHADRARRLEMQRWYEQAADGTCTEWLQRHFVARHALHSCMSCGVCASVCPAARFYVGYNPRHIVDVSLSGDEERIVQLLESEELWYCGQCGSCKPGCPRGNDVMALVSSLRLLSQLKGCHQRSVRGRQQYAARHLWGGNFWNRGCSLYFRNVDPETHPDFGPRFARYASRREREMERVGAHPDVEGCFGGRTLAPETIGELRQCTIWGGTLVLWTRLEDSAASSARELGLNVDEYLEQVRTEG